MTMAIQELVSAGGKKDDHDVPAREPWSHRPESSHRLLGLSDDELLYWIEALPADHTGDRDLLEIVRSRRHFFIRQEAAKRIVDASLLKDHAGDRHIGQILVRGMRRAEDASYLQRLIAETRHLEVRKAAEAQLTVILDGARRARIGELTVAHVLSPQGERS